MKNLLDRFCKYQKQNRKRGHEEENFVASKRRKKAVENSKDDTENLLLTVHTEGKKSSK